MVKIGRYTERITFQKNATITDRWGNHENRWIPFFTCYSYVMTYEKSEDGDVVIRSSESPTFECRYCPELVAIESSTKARIVYNGYVYDITGIDMMNYGRDTIKFKTENHGEKAEE